MGSQLPGKRPRRAAYALPTLFTSGNIFLGFVAIMQTFEGVRSGDWGHYSTAAKALGFAVFFDGLDGLVARMTNTTSDFGRELDSLADVVTFGIAPAVLAYAWGFLAVQLVDPEVYSHLIRSGYIVAFFYLLCGAVRLARFNVQTNPLPKNPGRPGRKYFVGMPIPAGAGLVAAAVYMDSSPIKLFAGSLLWMVAVCMVGLLMVSTWRYPSFKKINLTQPRSPLLVLVIGAVALIWYWSQPVLLIMAVTYVMSGILIRIGGILRRRRKSHPPAPLREHQVG